MKVLKMNGYKPGLVERLNTIVYRCAPVLYTVLNKVAQKSVFGDRLI